MEIPSDPWFHKIEMGDSNVETPSDPWFHKIETGDSNVETPSDPWFHKIELCDVSHIIPHIWQPRVTRGFTR